LCSKQFGAAHNVTFCFTKSKKQKNKQNAHKNQKKYSEKYSGAQSVNSTSLYELETKVILASALRLQENSVLANR